MDIIIRVRKQMALSLGHKAGKLRNPVDMLCSLLHLLLRLSVKKKLRIQG